jgi:predicted short-subunit dehydrogenase-like oxidoreductase (DUF2520 family)
VLAHYSARLGYDVVGLADKSPARVRAAGRLLGRRFDRLTAAWVAARSQVLFLTVPDREVARVYSALRPRVRPGTLVAHCSGFLGIETFAGAVEDGVETLAFHPAQAAAGGTGTADGLGRCTFAVDGSRVGLAFGRDLAQRLGGDFLLVRGVDRPLYHAMCVFVSNFQNALRESAERVARELGIPSDRVPRILDPLTRTTAENLLRSGAGPGLTGPVRRGDVATVAGHIAVLRSRVPELVPLYESLTRRLVELARSQEGVVCSELRAICEVLDE